MMDMYEMQEEVDCLIDDIYEAISNSDVRFFNKDGRELDLLDPSKYLNFRGNWVWDEITQISIPDQESFDAFELLMEYSGTRNQVWGMNLIPSTGTWKLKEGTCSWGLV